MSRIKNLTPATLKRIIAEEKFKINKAMSKSKKRKKMSNKQLVEAYIKCLRILKDAKSSKRRDLNKINEARNLIKKKLLERL
tara:strand:+ start:504 stop:749 length:246 start_codon:yes stop_codon:yes gene_type:complete